MTTPLSDRSVSEAATDEALNPAAMTERLIDAAIYAEQAQGGYRAGANKELADARHAIETALAASETGRRADEEERNRLKAALERTAGALQVVVAASRDIRAGDSIIFTGDWAHLGRATYSQILDQANAALTSDQKEPADAR